MLMYPLFFVSFFSREKKENRPLFWLCLVALGSGGVAVAEGHFDLAAQSCGVRCAGYVTGQLLGERAKGDALQAALGRADEATSLARIQGYLEGQGLYTLACRWSATAVARWTGELCAIVHLQSASCAAGHFVVVEKNASGITVVDWPDKRHFPATPTGVVQWKRYVAQLGVTETGLLISRTPIQLPVAKVRLSRVFFGIGLTVTVILLLTTIVRRRKHRHKFGFL